MSQTNLWGEEIDLVKLKQRVTGAKKKVIEAIPPANKTDAAIEIGLPIPSAATSPEDWVKWAYRVHELLLSEYNEKKRLYRVMTDYATEIDKAIDDMVIRVVDAAASRWDEFLKEYNESVAGLVEAIAPMADRLDAIEVMLEKTDTDPDSETIMSAIMETLKDDAEVSE